MRIFITRNNLPWHFNDIQQIWKLYESFISKE